MTFQMITNGGDTEGLFRAGWMESGSALPSGNFSKLQPTFDFIVSETGCASASDALECLRGVPAGAITAAMDKTPTFLSFQVREASFAGDIHALIHLSSRSTLRGCHTPTGCFSMKTCRGSCWKGASPISPSWSVRVPRALCVCVNLITLHFRIL